ncbi:KdsC family phosphatase [Mariniblastus fucicola]|uniref:3-deoxy-D-manno-octulosonate 8-phosphate phosphatase KdsC n=1 Tax=Mariniblastus fucicola TaxID=980251 RepID=A0A5B9PDL4_9BACT|nr:HAD hydrolase family protein [Mariniblastus fucicola]QEG24488.1 3-deoxy-D-manno-octulosonate 8-phosphate phosphatase KdsC [Mariniblastus fucicola]
MKLEQRMQGIQLILSDVDGVMTSGGITYDNQGVETKTFHVRDGMGIKLWQRTGYRFGIITARSSHIVKLRMDELGVDLVRQGAENKLDIAKGIMDEMSLSLEQVCYIGDDLTDMALLENVGLSASVSDGAPEVKKVAHMVTKSAGGQGAIRELVEAILKGQNRWQELLQSYSGS